MKKSYPLTIYRCGGEIVTAEASLKPMYDPKSERVRM